MRKLMWITVGFAAACCLTACFAYGSWVLLFALFLLMLCVGFLLRKKQAGKGIILFSIGFLLGAMWLLMFDRVHLKPIRDLNGQKVFTSITASDYSYETPRGTVVTGKIRLNGKIYKARVYLPVGETINPGDRVEGTFALRYTGPGGEKTPTYHQSKGIFVLGYSQKDWEVQSLDRTPFRYLPACIRHHTQQLIDRIFPENTAGFARALLLGDDSNLTEQMDSDLKISGIRHIVAVSGLHVSILFGLIYFLCGKRRTLTAALGIPLLLLFAGVAGFTPSIVRACVMQILMILALLSDREYDSPTALSFAVLVLLIVNPMVITSASFQLSVGCIVGILLVSEPIRQYLMDKKRMGRWNRKSFMGRLCRFVSSSVSVTLGAMLFTVPLCSFYFESVSLVGILTNLLTLWAVSIVFYGVLLSCLLGLIWTPAGIFLAKITSLFISYCLLTAGALARIPLAAIHTDNVYIGAWILFCYVLIFAFAVCRKKHPIVLIGCILAGLASSFIFVKLEPKTGDFCVSVLDVGQGQCVLLQNADQAYLVDCGSEREGKASQTAVQNLQMNGINHLDGLILTHYDTDHVNGTEGLLQQMEVRQLYLPDSRDDNGLREKIVEKNRGNITFVEETLTLTIPDGTLTIIPSHQGDTDNDSGLCVLFQPKGYDILITGDRAVSGEQELMEDVNLPELELLVVGHHGSRYSTGLDFLQKTKPKAAAISAGKNNRFGHPAQETLEKLKLFDCAIYRTDLDGTITFRGEVQWQRK